jgi:signal transduction histidine kinase
LVSHFLINVTTEFRTPLAALNASVEYLLDDLDSLSKDEVRELLQSIHLSVTGLHTLIENLIESSNIEAGRFCMRSGAIDLLVVVSEAVRFTRPLINRRRQCVIIERPDSLPWVQGDPARLTQVMVNLLSNASKSGPMNQAIHVTVEDASRGWLRITVADQSAGLRPDEQERLFDHSPGLIAAGNKPYNIELGLSLAKTIVEAHGGALGLETYPGGGSAVWFTLPTTEHWKRG